MAKWVGPAGAGRQADMGEREVACDFLCRFLVLTYDFPTLNEWSQRNLLVYKYKMFLCWQYYFMIVIL